MSIRSNECRSTWHGIAEQQKRVNKKLKNDNILIISFGVKTMVFIELFDIKKYYICISDVCSRVVYFPKKNILGRLHSLAKI